MGKATSTEWCCAGQSCVSVNPVEIGAGIHWAVDQGRVISISQVESESMRRRQHRCDTTDVAYAESHDVVIVAGAGNNNGLPNSWVVPQRFRGSSR
jgi:subtilisin family serine protease